MPHPPSPRRHATEWPTLVVLFACYGTWGGAGYWIYPHFPALGLALMALCVALHGSLQHEAIHGHPTRWQRLNEALVSLPLGVIYPYRRYRTLHLRHHADHHLTDPWEDPESYYHDPKTWLSMPTGVRMLLTCNQSFAGRMILGPWIGAIRFLVADCRLLRQGGDSIRHAWLLHGAGLLALGAFIIGACGIPPWLYILVPVYGGLALTGIRSFAEHRWHEDPKARSVIVERSLLAALFLFNNLHVVHHARPGLAWFRLPRAYEAQRAMWQRLNAGYVYQGYRTIALRYFWRLKEPLPHPGRQVDRVP